MHIRLDDLSRFAISCHFVSRRPAVAVVCDVKRRAGPGFSHYYNRNHSTDRNLSLGMKLAQTVCMKALMKPSRLAAILLLGVLPLSAVRQCCIPSVVKAEASHCSHPDESNAPQSTACKTLDEAVFERLPSSIELHILRVDVAGLAASLNDDVLLARNGWMMQPDIDSGLPAELAFLHHSPLRI